MPEQDAMIRRLELHISYSCVQSCLFCSESDRMERFRRFPVKAGEIARVLAIKRRQGFDHVTITGGEPTIYPGFLGVLKAAKGLGFTTYVTSNGSRLADRGFAGKVLGLIDELCLSIHGDAPDLHDAMAGVPGGFSKLLKAFSHAGGRKGLFLLTNTVVTRRNWARLEDTLRFILGLGFVRHCLLSHVAPEGRGARRYGELAVPFSWWRRKIPRLARLAGKRGVTLRIFGLPLCVLGRNRECSNDSYFSPRVTVERARVAGVAGLAEITSLSPTRRRTKLPVCAVCAARDDCGGVFRRHLKEFGAKDLRPILSGYKPILNGR